MQLTTRDRMRAKRKINTTIANSHKIVKANSAIFSEKDKAFAARVIRQLRSKRLIKKVAIDIKLDSSVRSFLGRKH